MLNEKNQPLFILSTSDIGAGKAGAGQGPQAVKDEVEALGIVINEFELVNHHTMNTQYIAHDFGKHIEDIVEAMGELNDKVVKTIESKRFPIILSGDHSNAIGGLSGLKNAHPDKRIGVIWVDAHADLHSPYTTPSGNIHGMPLAALAGLDHLDLQKNEVAEDVAYYWDQLKQLGLNNISPKFDIKDLVLIGVRDAEDEEWVIIDKVGIKTFEPNDIRAKGMKQVISDACYYLKDCDLLYISFDADSLDPTVSVGTGTTAPDGLSVEQAEMIFSTLMSHPKIGAFEITEVNPQLDGEGKAMAKVIAHLLHHGLTH
ncbi:MAG: arginase [Bacteroidota bacterium]